MKTVGQNKSDPV